MALISLGRGFVNFATATSYNTPYLSVSPGERRAFVVNLITDPFERRYEYVIVVPVFNTAAGLMRGEEVARYYLGSRPMLFNVLMPEKEFGSDLEISLILLPQSIYRRQAVMQDIELEVLYSDGKGIE